MRIQIVPRSIEVEEQPDGSRIIRMVDASNVEVSIGPVPADKWDDFLEYLRDPQAAKERQAAKSSIHIPGGPVPPA